jgi:hypothetical protein
LFFPLFEIFGCYAILNDASFFYIEKLWLLEKKKVRIYHEFGLFMGALGKMIKILVRTCGLQWQPNV